MKRLAPLAALMLPALALGGCVSAPAHDDLAAAQPVFDPMTFFEGASEGNATLKKIFSGTKPVHVVSHGRIENGVLVLDQTIAEGSKSPHDREWRIRRIADNRYTGTLSEATGPISADVSGNRLHITYTMHGGFPVEQWIYLQPGGQTALNRMVVRKFGMPVAALEETITRQ